METPGLPACFPLISLLFFGTLHSNAYIFPFPLCFLLLFFSPLFVRHHQTAILPFCISLSWGWSCSPSPVQCYDHPSIVHQVGKTSRPFRYDLYQIPNDYTVEVRNRFKGLDQIDRVSDELWLTLWGFNLLFIWYYQRKINGINKFSYDNILALSYGLMYVIYSWLLIRNSVVLYFSFSLSSLIAYF